MAMIKCPECGRMISDRADMCLGCGISQKVIQELMDQESQPQEKVIRRSKRMITCVACHQENDENAFVCKACGYALLSLSSDKKKVRKSVEAYKRREVDKKTDKPVKITSSMKRPDPEPIKPEPIKNRPGQGNMNPVQEKQTSQWPISTRPAPPTDKKSGKTKVIAAAVAGVVCVGIGLFLGKKPKPQPVASAESTVSAESEISPPASESKYEITFILSLRDEFRCDLEKGAQYYCPPNVNLTTMDAQNDAAKQQQLIESARNAANDAIIVNLVDPASAWSMFESAGAGDTPVVFVDRYPTDDSVLDPNKCAFVGSDEVIVGYNQGWYLTDYFNAKGQKDITYVTVQGEFSEIPTTTTSALQALEFGDLNITRKGSPLVGEFDRAIAKKVFYSLLSNGETDFDCVICNNDAMALGVFDAMAEFALDPREIPIVGLDATADGRQAIKDGKLAMSVFRDPIGQGKAAIFAAVNMIEGNALDEGTDYEVSPDNPAVILVPCEVVWQDNVADYDADYKYG